MLRKHLSTRYFSKFLLVLVITTALLSTTLINVRPVRAAVALPPPVVVAEGNIYIYQIAKCVTDQIGYYRINQSPSARIRVVQWHTSLYQGLQQWSQGKKPNLNDFAVTTACISGVPRFMNGIEASLYNAFYTDALMQWAQPIVVYAFNDLKDWLKEVGVWFINGVNGGEESPPPRPGTPDILKMSSTEVETLLAELAPPVPLPIATVPDDCQSADCSGASVVAFCPDSTLVDSPDQCSGLGDVAINTNDSSPNTDTITGEIDSGTGSVG